MDPAYPFIRLFVRYAKALALGLSALVLILGAIAVAAGLPAWVLLAAIVLAAIAFAVMRLVGELVTLIADTLLPQ